jgi:hypothetical protein
MGAIEESGKVASNVVGALQNQPVVLAMVIFNAIFVGAVYFSLREARIANQTMSKQMLEMIDKQSDLLSKCIVPNPRNSAATFEPSDEVPLPKPRPAETEGGEPH